MTLALPASELAAGKLCGSILLAKGLTKPQASGPLSSFQGETDFLPRPGDHGEADGLAQWHWNPRGAAILKGCGIDVRIAALDQQIEAFWWEITEGGEKATYAHLKECVTAEEAAAAMVNWFERPANRAAAIARRTPYAVFWESQI